MFEIRRYGATDKQAWDAYVAKARNATFLFHRDYMDYHADRFCDHSLLFYASGRLFALMPAHAEGEAFCTHLGLTYGGLVVGDDVTTAAVVRLFAQLNAYLRGEGFRRVVYRPVPWVYHRLPAEEDLYAMFWQGGARLQRRMAGTVVFMREQKPWRKDHRRRLRQAQAAGIGVEQGGALADFWQLLEANLKQRFGARPVHTLAEMELLKSRFPRNIILYSAYHDNQLVGGILFYVMGHVLHGQYSATNEAGKRLGAMEAIYHRVWTDFADVRYLDFGTSNEDGGRLLNEGLIDHKEGYGGRTVCYDTYEWEL